jgi:hypothetical protein
MYKFIISPYLTKFGDISVPKMMQNDGCKYSLVWGRLMQQALRTVLMDIHQDLRGGGCVPLARSTEV